jgi:phage terminase small subunit
MKEVRNYLIKKYGEVKPEWEVVLEILEDDVNLYRECKKNIKEYGLIIDGKKNPIILTLRDLQVQILKCVKELGLSPYAISRININDEDETEDFIEGLVNE